MKYNSVKTLWLAHIDVCRSTPSTYSPLPNSTLNEALEVAQSATLPGGTLPEIGYLCIGRRGHRVRNATTGTFDTLQHDSTDARLFEHIPWAAVPKVGQGGAYVADSEPDFIDQLRLKKEMQINGTWYDLFYAIAIDFSSSGPEFNVLTTENGETSSATFVSTAAQLSPTPVDPNTTTAKDVSVTVPANLTYGTNYTQSISDACELLYNDTGYATISEIAVVAGHEIDAGAQSVPGYANGENEIIGAVCCNFNSDLIHLDFPGKVMDLSYALGDVLPYSR